MAWSIAQSLASAIHTQLSALQMSEEEDQDLDKTVLALLEELYRKFERAEPNDKGEVTIEFSKVQCLAMRLVFAGQLPSNDTANWLHIFCNEIEQRFSNTFYKQQILLTNGTNRNTAGLID